MRNLAAERDCIWVQGGHGGEDGRSVHSVSPGSTWGVCFYGDGPFLMHPLLLGEGVHPHCSFAWQRRQAGCRHGIGSFPAGCGLNGQRQPSWLTRTLRIQCHVISGRSQSILLLGSGAGWPHRKQAYYIGVKEGCSPAGRAGSL